MPAERTWGGNSSAITVLNTPKNTATNTQTTSWVISSFCTVGPSVSQAYSG